MENTINSIKIELEILEVEKKIEALLQERKSKAEETIHRAKLDDVNAIVWNGQKIKDLNHEIDKLDYYMRGMKAAARIIKGSN